ncbi:MAG: SAM-dependent methyltransferase [Mariprofundaceae bacterium]|nr:SAM-dependent methyltransferase [Mariprofundaceae bacterium]
MAETLSEEIRRNIEQQGGWLSFAAFMQAALYSPERGYYESAQVFGKDGDFITGTDVGPWLALGMADLMACGWQQLGCPEEWTMMEQGGGEGRLLCDVLKLLQEKNIAMPTQVMAVEKSTHMRTRQALAYAEISMDVVQFSELNDVPQVENLLFFCNELPDAFPVRCFTHRGGVMCERGVGLSAAGDFVWQDDVHGAASAVDMPSIDAKLMDAWPDGYISEWNPQLDAWQADISRVMQRGLLFCVDYGYAQSEYYRPQRIEGTLLAHLQHQVTPDVLSDPGSRDITAHVDFTALARAGNAAALAMNCWMTQGAWLAQSPSVQAHIQKVVMQGNAESAALMSEAKRMLLPQGMGDLFKISMQSKGMDAATPDYLSSFNRLHALRLVDA